MRARLFWHVAQRRAARFLAAVAWVAALVTLLVKGPGPAIAVALLGCLFGAAVPGPDPTLDRFTGRGRD